MNAVAEYDRDQLIVELGRTIKNPKSTADEILAAQSQLDEFAREILEWFRPTGYRLLLYVPELQAGLVRMSDKSEAEYRAAAIHGYVLAMGDLAYQDEKRFPNGPWCKVGDRVMFRAYSGTRFNRAGYPFLYVLINDDTVEAVMWGDEPVERPH